MSKTMDSKSWTSAFPTLFIFNMNTHFFLVLRIWQGREKEASEKELKAPDQDGGIFPGIRIPAKLKEVHTASILSLYSASHCVSFLWLP